MTLGLGTWVSATVAVVFLVHGNGPVASPGRTWISGRMTHGGQAAMVVAPIGKAVHGIGGLGPVQPERAQASSRLFIKILHGQHGTEARANSEAAQRLLNLPAVLLLISMVVFRVVTVVHQTAEQLGHTVQTPTLAVVGQLELLQQLLADRIPWRRNE